MKPHGIPGSSGHVSRGRRVARSRLSVEMVLDCVLSVENSRMQEIDAGLRRAACFCGADTRNEVLPYSAVGRQKIEDLIELKPSILPSSFMAPKLSKIQRTELQKLIIRKLKGEESITDKERAQTIIPYTNRSSRAIEHTSTWHDRRSLNRRRIIEGRNRSSGRHHT